MGPLRTGGPYVALTLALVLSCFSATTQAQNQQAITILGNETDSNDGRGVSLVQLLPDPTFWLPTQTGSTSRTFIPGSTTGPCVLIRAIFNGTSVVFSGSSFGMASSTLKYSLDGTPETGTPSGHIDNGGKEDTVGLISDNPGVHNGNLTFQAPPTSYQHILVISSDDCSSAALDGLTFESIFFNVSVPTEPGPPSPQTTIRASDFPSAPDPAAYVNNVSITFNPPYTLASSGLESLSSTSNVTMSMEFLGQSVSLLMNPPTPDGPYPTAQLFVDGVFRSDLPPTESGAEPADFLVSGLSPGWHAVDVRTLSPGSLSFESATINAPTGPSVSSTNLFGPSSTPSATSTIAAPPSLASSEAGPAQASQHRDLAGPIAGSVVGAIAIAALVVLSFILRERCRNRPHYDRPTLPMTSFDDDTLRNTASPLTIRSESHMNESFSSQIDALVAMSGSTALSSSPPRQLRAQRTGLGTHLEAKIRERDALEDGFGSHPVAGHVLDWRDHELERLRFETAELYTALDAVRSGGSGTGGRDSLSSDALPDYQGDPQAPTMLDEKVRERDALEETIRGSMGAGTSQPEGGPSASAELTPDWRDKHLAQMKAEVSQLHTALGLVQDPPPLTSSFRGSAMVRRVQPCIL